MSDFNLNVSVYVNFLQSERKKTFFIIEKTVKRMYLV